MKRQKGFTLIELLIALTVAGILLVAAIPGFSDFVKNNRQSTQINSLLNALITARSEAITGNQSVSVCQSNDGANCTNTGWNNGWIVFSDGNVAGTVDGTDQILQVFGAIFSTTTLTSANFPNFITYRSDSTSSNSGDFKMCDDRGPSSARALCITQTGENRVSKLDCAGAALTCP